MKERSPGNWEPVARHFPVTLALPVWPVHAEFGFLVGAAVRQNLVGIAQVLDSMQCPAPDTPCSMPDERIRLHSTVGAGFGNRRVMGNVIDEAVHALDRACGRSEISPVRM